MFLSDLKTHIARFPEGDFFQFLITNSFCVFTPNINSVQKLQILSRNRNVMYPEFKVGTLYPNTESEPFRSCERFVSKFQFELAPIRYGFIMIDK